MGNPDHTKLIEELAADRERYMHTPESRQELLELYAQRGLLVAWEFVVDGPEQGTGWVLHVVPDGGRPS